MNILVCIKRVPAPGTKIVLTDDEQEIVTRNLGFAISPHEECAVEEAVRLIEKYGGTSTVLTLGPEGAIEQLRGSLAIGIEHATLLETDGSEWDPMATSKAIVEAVRTLEDEGNQFDMLFFGNESADSGGYQVGIRVAHALDLPCVSGIKGLEIEDDGTAIAKREASGGWELYEVELPAVFTMKEGINLPRYPPMRGRLRAKRKNINRIEPEWDGGGLKKVRLKNPPEQGSTVEILGNSVDAVPQIIEILTELGMV